MKHLRECECTEAYLSLCKYSRVELEHPLLSQLHSVLVARGNFLEAEAVMQQAAEGEGSSLLHVYHKYHCLHVGVAEYHCLHVGVAEYHCLHVGVAEYHCLHSDGFLDSFISKQPIQAKWTPITPASGGLS